MCLFVTFEGPEGSGKTTQIQLLSDHLRAQGRDVVTTREPGGTAIGNAIRAVLLSPAHQEMSPRAETLLFNAARAQIVDEVIRPALAAGRIVLCDRFADSTLAYQGYGRRQNLDELALLGRYATGGLQPDLTFYLDLDPADGLRRKRAGNAEEWNRMEEQTLAYHQDVRAGYHALAARNPDRWVIVDAIQTPKAVQAMLRTALATRLT